MATLETDVSTGKVADSRIALEACLPDDLLRKFELYSYRNAAAILRSSFPGHFAEIVDMLRRFSISKTMIRTPGGSKSQIAKYVDTLFDDTWQETRISADLHVRLMHADLLPLESAFIS